MTSSIVAYCFRYIVQFSRCNQIASAILVGLRGLEPPTLRLSGVRSNHLSYKPLCPASVGFSLSSFACGGDEENRTPDPLLARQVLSQLSYTPIYARHFCGNARAATRARFRAETSFPRMPPFALRGERRFCISLLWLSWATRSLSSLFHFLKVQFDVPSKLNNDTCIRTLH